MIIFVLAIAVAAIFSGFLKIDLQMDFDKALLMLLFLALFIVPAEEIIFRGFIGGWIGNH